MYNRILSLLIASFFLLMPANIMAEETKTSGEVKIGVQGLDKKGADSSKFNEYRDIKDGLYLYELNAAIDTPGGYYLNLKGTDIGRLDQDIMVKGGGNGTWGLKGEWNETPHLLSNKAKTPYNYQGNGLYTYSGNSAGTTSLTAASTAQDTLVSNFLNSNVHSTDLKTQRKEGSVELSYTPTASLGFKLGYSDESKEGNILTGAPLGDRPPRTMNVQLTEPVKYSTKNFTAEGEYKGEILQANVKYLLSEFKNDVDSLTWQSIFFGEDSASGTQDYNNDIGRTTSTYGRMALPPDNKYQNTTLSVGLDLPLNSRLMANAAWGTMEQNDDLFPYSYSTLTSDWNALSKLPSSKADAKLGTVNYSVDYIVNPVKELNLKAFYKSDELTNSTPKREWYYVTSDAAAGTGATTAVNNQRKNLPYSYKKSNIGVDAAYSFYLATIGIGYEKEDIDRNYREADTSEGIFRVSLNSNLARWLSIRLKYLNGQRDNGTYNSEITDESYHFSNAADSGNDRPYAAFGNHPDLRKSDVSDRKRSRFDASASLMPKDNLGISLSYSLTTNDYDSGVSSVTPLSGVSVANSAAQAGATAGSQLGLLKDETSNYSIDADYRLSKDIFFNFFVNGENFKTEQRGMAFDENNRISSSFDWNQTSKQWMLNINDKTDTIGVGGGYEIISEILNFTADYSYAFGAVNIDYSGYGSDKALNSDTYYYAFSDPENVSHKQQTVNASLEYKGLGGMVLGLGYLFDKYEINDYMLGQTGGWVETVGSEYMLRDSSRDNRWGNRLVSLGSYLGPSYENHVGSLTLTYKW